MLERVRSFIDKHKKKIAIGLIMIAGGYYFYNYATDEKEIKLSAFIEALQLSTVTEAVVESNRVIRFRSGESEWFYTFVGSFPIDTLCELLTYSPIHPAQRKSLCPLKRTSFLKSWLTQECSHWSR